MVQEKRPTGLVENIASVTKTNRRLLDMLEGTQKKKTKKYKLPRKMRKGFKNKIKTGKVLVIRVKENHQIVPEWIKVVDGMIKLSDNDTYHAADAKYICSFGKKRIPTMILLEWSLTPVRPGEPPNYLMERETKSEPLSFKDHREKTEEEGAEAIHQKVIIKAINLYGVGGLKKKMGGKTLLIMLVLGVVVVYLISKMFGGG